MSKGHFELIVDVISDSIPNDTEEHIKMRETICSNFANRLVDTNEFFDYDLFKERCEEQ